MDFSKVFQAKMEEQNLRTVDIAKLTGYTQAHCNDLLKRNRRWNQDTIRRFCKALGLKVIIVPNEPANKQNREGA